MQANRDSDRPESGGGILFDGVLVTVRPERLEPCCRVLEGLPGVEVHQREARTGRVVVVVESRDSDELTATLRRIRGIPDVLLTAVVYHYPAPALPQAEVGPAEQRRTRG